MKDKFSQYFLLKTINTFLDTQFCTYQYQESLVIWTRDHAYLVI